MTNRDRSFRLRDLLAVMAVAVAVAVGITIAVDQVLFSAAPRKARRVAGLLRARLALGEECFD